MIYNIEDIPLLFMLEVWVPLKLLANRVVKFTWPLTYLLCICSKILYSAHENRHQRKHYVIKEKFLTAL